MLHLTLTEVDETIPAGTPFIARTSTDNTVLTNSAEVTFGETTSTPEPTQLTVYNTDGTVNPSLTVKIGGTYARTTDLSSDNYRAFTNTGSFGPCEWVNCFRAYVYKADTPAARIKNIVLDLDDDATGIEAIENATAMSGNKTYYNLNGQRMTSSNMKSGLYIVNGKKIIKK